MRYHELLESKRNDMVRQIINEPLLRLRQGFQAQDRDIRLVGGGVRDILLGKKPKDIDLATDATPDEQIAIYQSLGLIDSETNKNVRGDRFIRTGIDHGTLTVMLSHIPYEITSLRTESDHTGRHATVAFTRDWIDDLSRRDLTVNSMMLTFDGDLVDPFGGQQDLERGIIRFVGNPEERIQEDFLRILRYFRFDGRLNHSNVATDPRTEAAIRNSVDGLGQLSGERIWMEIAKIIAGPNGPAMMQKMCAFGISKKISLPCRNHVALKRAYKVTHNPVTLLSAILDTPEEVDGLVARWKLSSEERELARFLVANKKAAMTIERLQDYVVHGVRRDWVAELARLGGKPGDALTIARWEAPSFPVSGRDLMAAGMAPGIAMGDVLRGLRQRWIASRFTLDKMTLLAQVNRG